MNLQICLPSILYLSLALFKVDMLQSVVVRAGQNSKTAGVRWLLQQESCTWRLITSLYRYASFLDVGLMRCLMPLNPHGVLPAGIESSWRWMMT